MCCSNHDFKFFTTIEVSLATNWNLRTASKKPLPLRFAGARWAYTEAEGYRARVVAARAVLAPPRGGASVPRRRVRCGVAGCRAADWPAASSWPPRAGTRAI